MKIYEPNNVPSVDAIKRILDKIELNNAYGHLAGGSSLDYAASTFFSGSKYEDFPVTTVRPVDDPDNYDHCWGVHLPYCKSQDMMHYMQWCNGAVDGYEVDPMGRHFWFRKEQDRTMFLLRWS